MKLAKGNYQKVMYPAFVALVLLAAWQGVVTGLKLPPDRLRGRAWANFASPTSARASTTRASASTRGTPARSSGSRTLLSTLAQGISVGDWNTKPSRRPGPPVAAKSPPHHDSDPCDGVTSPARRLSNVVLPQPEGPSNVTNSPLPMARSTGASARVPLA